ncbi:MAG: nuclear transport factor 2 family protein [Betaproteobacteria bacterium]
MYTRAFVSSVIAAMALGISIAASAADDAALVAAQDTAYQLAVERNDWQAMDRILHPEMVLVVGTGKVIDRKGLIESAKSQAYSYEKQVEMPGTQQVRLFGKDTATVTALLWLKGKRNGDKSEFDYKLWFTDTYVRTADGWRYAFGQASLRLPKE